MRLGDLCIYREFHCRLDSPAEYCYTFCCLIVGGGGGDCDTGWEIKCTIPSMHQAGVAFHKGAGHTLNNAHHSGGSIDFLKGGSFQC